MTRYRILLAANIAVALFIGTSAQAQQPRLDGQSAAVEVPYIVAANYATSKRKAGRRLRGVWTCYQQSSSRCCYNSVTGEEFCTAWPPR